MAEDKLHKYLEPILGTACTAVAIEYLEELNPELKNNNDLRDIFINTIDKIPEDDKNYVVAAALKISKIKNIRASQGDDFEFAGAYKDFESITTRLLKNFYNIAKYADSIISDNTLTDDEKIKIIDSPVFSARTIILNDSINKDKISISQARNEIDMIVRSSAGGMQQFPLIVEYIAQKSGKAAEIMFNHKEFRNFSKWQKAKIVQNSQKQALRNEQKTITSPIIKKEIQNG